MFFKLTPTIKTLTPFFLAGLLLPLGFAPFHLPGFSILGVGMFFYLLQNPTLKYTLSPGFAFGLGYFGLGVSWVYISIRVYGHIHPFLASFITLFFIFYLSLFTAFISGIFRKFFSNTPFIFSCFLFSALWCIAEFMRSMLFGGFPWLQLGFSQMDTPLRFTMSLVGIYGVGFLVCLTATFLVAGVQKGRPKQYLWTFTALLILLGPSLLEHKQWTQKGEEPQKIAVIQGNLSMRDKWDESIFWKLLSWYGKKIQELISEDNIIVLPESAFPVPPSYIADFLDELDNQAKKLKSSILLGIPQSATVDESEYYNSMIALGAAEGVYIKQHLVPFGEYIPSLFERFTNWLELPSSNMRAGKSRQKLINVNARPIASLICYELAYPALLRNQLPEAQWIVSISDDGWFGHSFAMYQQLQMAQALSLQTGRYQVLANNDGLSSVINSQGEIIASLPAFKAKTLQANIYPATGSTPWVYIGDIPFIVTFFSMLFFGILYNFTLLLNFKQTTA